MGGSEKKMNWRITQKYQICLKDKSWENLFAIEIAEKSAKRLMFSVSQICLGMEVKRWKMLAIFR